MHVICFACIVFDFDEGGENTLLLSSLSICIFFEVVFAHLLPINSILTRYLSVSVLNQLESVLRLNFLSTESWQLQKCFIDGLAYDALILFGLMYWSHKIIFKLQEWIAARNVDAFLCFEIALWVHEEADPISLGLNLTTNPTAFQTRPFRCKIVQVTSFGRSVLRYGKISLARIS